MAAAWQAASPAQRRGAAAVAARMLELRVSLQAIAETVDAAAHCADCGGACCRSGRYHFRAADLVVYLATGEALFAPQFGNGLCPYLEHGRCLMTPAYRPFNCITFNCERIEDEVPAAERERFYRLERELRQCYSEMESLFPGGELFGALLRLDATP